MAMGEALALRVHDAGDHLATGFLGTPVLLPGLADTGHLDVAYAVLLQRTHPSWLFQVLAGATTIWERWDALRPDGSVAIDDLGSTGGSMVSFNHYAYGAVAEWLHAAVAGLRPDPADPGYHHVLVEPRPGGGLTSASASLQTRFGRVAVAWTLGADGGLEVDVEVPPNASATVTRSGHAAVRVGSGRHHFASWPRAAVRSRTGSCNESDTRPQPEAAPGLAASTCAARDVVHADALMRIRLGCRFDYEVEEPAPSLWQVRPRPDGPHRVLSETWSPPAPPHTYLDAYGNSCDRLTLPAGRSTLTYDAEVEVPSEVDEADPSAGETPLAELPDEAFVYLLPSRFCWPDLLFGAAWDLFGSVAPGWARVQAVSDWVHGEISYEVGASTAITTAMDVWESRTGVCRDFTHLGMTLCRALNVPARYVGGYLPDIGVPTPDLPMDFCSWYEVWLGGRWWTFDPRNNEPRVGRVVVARGRDALDAAMVTTWGPAELVAMEVWADEATDAS